ncbi:MAG: hypothetical protein HY534_06810 [Chloroflexi bacterium]|nr:hypothetical protein [Chloroflexota bacterium]
MVLHLPLVEKVLRHGAMLMVGALLGTSFVIASPARAQDQSLSARYWEQLTGLLEPVMMPTMTDHRAFMLPGGAVIALHFDNLNLSRAENLNWVALGVPGSYCASDQARVEAEFGPGFTHFHDMVNDIHGGAPGASGVWFVHSAVRAFDSPMSGGAVEPGVDMNFMPTPAPDC